jgi:hypothetical protein
MNNLIIAALLSVALMGTNGAQAAETKKVDVLLVGGGVSPRPRPIAIRWARSTAIPTRTCRLNRKAATGSSVTSMRAPRRFIRLATLAVKHLIQQAQSHWHLGRLLANVYAENIGSVKVLQRCGFLVDQSRREQSGRDDWYSLSI